MTLNTFGGGQGGGPKASRWRSSRRLYLTVLRRAGDGSRADDGKGGFRPLVTQPFLRLLQLPEQCRLMHIQPPKKKNKQKHKQSRTQDPVPPGKKRLSSQLESQML